MPTFRRLILVCLIAAGAAFAQTWQVKQLLEFLKNSKGSAPDKQVAEYLKRVSLTERLSGKALDEAINLAGGAQTIHAIHDLASKSADRPEPAVNPIAPPKPKPAPIPPPSEEQKAEVMAKVTEFARGYIKSLPNFTCTQLTERYVDPSGRDAYQLSDKVVETLSYLEGREDYKVLTVNSKPMIDKSHWDLGGTTSAGEFGTDLAELFSPEVQTEFEWNSWTTWHGRRTHRIAYRVLQSRSHWNIVFEKTQSMIAGYKGMLYVDADLKMVMRITREAVGIPSDFPIQNVQQSTEYEFTKIGESDQEFLLPSKSLITSRSGRASVKNATTFHHYRKFGADIKITFDPVEESKPPKQ